ncbi:MAG: outer membrane beta-barrel protein [Bacteroidia bacterium]
MNALGIFQSLAQNASAGSISGTMLDSKTSQAIEYGAVAVLKTSDSTIAGGAVSDENGNFKIESLPFGNYLLKFTIIGYRPFKTLSFSLDAANPEKIFGPIKLRSSVTSLTTVDVEAKQDRVQQNGDTIGYNAKSYKTNPDANAEDLINKMPGLSSDNGSVKAHGEDVKKVLVDGKPFFGDDVSMALKNLPAEVIDKIQVYDKASDQSQFTGFDDGQSSKTINIITRPGKNNGEFGKIYAGYGTDDTYIVGGNLNIFKGNRRISILGLTNNINQQNFTSQDLLGLTSGGGGAGGGRGGFGGGGAGGPGGGGPGGGAANNFLVGAQPGIATTNAIGFNYSDDWGKKIKVTASYFFNMTDTKNTTMLTRNYITSKDSGTYYNEADESRIKNMNHRFNLRFEYKIDSLNSLIVTPKFNYQKNNSMSTLLGTNIRKEENVSESRTNTTNNSLNSGYTFSNNILLQHKFAKRGRTFSINLGTDLNDKKGNSSLYSKSNYYYMNDSTLTDQHSTQHTNGYTLSTSLVYTEPIDSFSQLMFTYTPSYSNNLNDKETNNFNYATSDYSSLDTLLSNKYKSIYVSNRGGIGYNRNKKKYMFMATVNAQYATLTGSQNFPVAFDANKSFFSVLPQAMFNYKFSRGTNLRIFYRTGTTTPTITQLQNVINNSNPILLTTGNPDLKQDYEHTFIVRYGKTNPQKATGLFLFLYGTYQQNYIGNSTLVPTHDTTINDAFVLKRGSQLSKPVNLQGYGTSRAVITYSLPVSKIKCNVNFNASGSYTRTPGLVNELSNIANNYTVSGGAGISSNISEKLDFNINYNINYSTISNTLQTQSNNNYYYQTTSLKLNWMFWKGFVFNTNITHTLYSGLSQSYNQSYILWNASLAYKFLKNQSFEVKASVFDMLGQNQSINRTVTDTYIEDSSTKVLTRYYMLTLTYNLRKFKP